MTPCHDTEFTGENIKTFLQNCYIRDVCTTAKILNLMPCVKECTNGRKCPKNIILWGPPQYMASTKDYINEALSIALHAMKAAMHSTL
jgi:hypothetical protein